MTGQMSGAQRRDLRRQAADHRTLQEIGLELQQPFVARGAAIHPEFFQGRRTVLLHGVEDIADLVGDGFQGRAHQVRPPAVLTQTAEQSTGFGPPVRGAKATQGRDEVDATVVRQRRGFGGQHIQVPCTAQQASRPADRGAGVDDVAFQGKGRSIPQAPGQGGGQAMGGHHRLGNGCHQRRTRTQGGLDLAWDETALAEQGRMGIADHRQDRQTGWQGALGARLAKVAGTGSDLRQRRPGNVEEAQQLRVPVAAPQVEQLGTGRVGRVDEKARATAELPEQPAVHGAQADFACGGAGRAVGDLIE